VDSHIADKIGAALKIDDADFVWTFVRLCFVNLEDTPGGPRNALMGGHG
jgi:hypothetical protein